MILLDTNIISTFAKIKKFQVLFEVFNARSLYISPNVHSELKIAKGKGYSFVDKILNLANQNKIIVLPLTPKEKIGIKSVPDFFHPVKGILLQFAGREAV
ncbi:hypothetical protein HYX06_01370 [Candidatus Woesearchaeota archaeon]|nr:hypothetical protein [Candidatus Woesearchaeota archaeon]